MRKEPSAKLKEGSSMNGLRKGQGSAEGNNLTPSFVIYWWTQTLVRVETGSTDPTDKKPCSLLKFFKILYKRPGGMFERNAEGAYRGLSTTTRETLISTANLPNLKGATFKLEQKEIVCMVNSGTEIGVTAIRASATGDLNAKKTCRTGGVTEVLISL
ncbi:hypothetical protein J6590_016859 [Homalodisca vitripennis]|nr:hypothetical protein J6590_016859 [Homalodisca vitripennis]